MGANKGEHIPPENLKVRATLSDVIFRGACGQKMHITIEEWKQLKKDVDKQIRKARRDAMKNPINIAMATSPYRTMLVPSFPTQIPHNAFHDTLSDRDLAQPLTEREENNEQT